MVCLFVESFVEGHENWDLLTDTDWRFNICGESHLKNRSGRLDFKIVYIRFKQKSVYNHIYVKATLIWVKFS